jgi:hypothetical protein
MIRPPILKLGLFLLTIFSALWGADLSAPNRVVAGTAITLTTIGSGSGVLYLVGPATRLKFSVRLGEDLKVGAENVRAAGLYTAILKTTDERISRSFTVGSAAPETVNFLAQPSRVPVDANNAISGTVFVMDEFDNLVLTPVPVQFELTVANAPAIARKASTREGVAWVRLSSGRRAGNASFTASVEGTSVRRVVQQVAAEPCNLRIHAQPSPNGILVETDPVRDCAGNPVPDGTIVTITGTDPEGKNTVDAVVKKGVARAELPPAARATISVASGVIGGNEIRWQGGGR